VDKDGVRIDQVIIYPEVKVGWGRF
jgi:hypothetical protein